MIPSYQYPQIPARTSQWTSRGTNDSVSSRALHYGLKSCSYCLEKVKAFAGGNGGDKPLLPNIGLESLAVGSNQATSIYVNIGSCGLN